jgi:glycosyltransferase involved in cell wall biosynthesis
MSAPPTGRKLCILGSRGFPSTYGGYETLVRHLARHMVHEGHEVTVYCRTRDEGRHSWITEDVRCIATPGRDSKSLSTLSYGLTSTIDAVFRRFDAVLVLNIANGFWLPLLRASRTPFAINTDGIEWERGKWSPLGRATFKAGARMTARCAPALICDSVAIGDVWQREFGRSSSFIPYGAVVHEDVPTDRIDMLGLDPESYLLTVARLVPENNVELTLDAVERMGTRGPRPVIVGSANFDSPIEHRLKALEAEGKVMWLGHVDDQELLRQLWAHAGVYVHGHSVGGTNPALLQALGAGAPTLALDTVFNSEVLPIEEQRYRHDVDALVERVEHVVGSAAVRADMRERGQQIIGERYAWNDVCGRYTELLLSLSDRKTGAVAA